MMVRLLLFARARDLVGADWVNLEIPEQSTVAQLRDTLENCYPALAAILPHAAFAVDLAFAPDTMQIGAGAEVALLPPVSGGQNNNLAVLEG